MSELKRLLALSYPSREDMRTIVDLQGKQLEKAFQVLESLGVPRERAKTVANGIDVYASRMSHRHQKPC